MDYDLIVVKTLERVYKNYYYIIRGLFYIKIYPRETTNHFIPMLLLNYEYLGTSDTGELALKDKTTGNFLILSFDYEYIYCKTIH